MTYLPVAVAGVVVAAAVFALAVPRWRARGELGEVLGAVAVAAVVLMALTVVFDSVMIAAGLFRYGDGTLTGVRLWRAPVEDLSYPLAAVLLVAGLWELVGPRRKDRS